MSSSAACFAPSLSLFRLLGALSPCRPCCRRSRQSRPPRRHTSKRQRCRRTRAAAADRETIRRPGRRWEPPRQNLRGRRRPRGLPSGQPPAFSRQHRSRHLSPFPQKPAHTHPHARALLGCRDLLRSPSVAPTPGPTTRTSRPPLPPRRPSAMSRLQCFPSGAYGRPFAAALVMRAREAMNHAAVSHAADPTLRSHRGAPRNSDPTAAF